MDYIKFKVDEAKMLEVRDFYRAEKIDDPKQEYHEFIKKLPNGVIVNGYSSKKGYSIVFSGTKERILLESSLFFKNPKVYSSKSNSSTGWEDTDCQIGSDEVGVGDFFLGFYVCATYLDRKDVDFINSLGVMDSKKMNDSKIEEIAPILKKRIKNFVVRISPDKLTQMHDKKWSTHMMLVKTHNFAQEQLIKKYRLKSDITVFIDQFEKEKTYRKYAGDQIIKNPLVFQTKGESHFPSVAAASVIARYEFLQDWKKMESELNCSIPKGASVEVDKTYKKLVKKHGVKRINPYVKRFFRNYKI